MPGEEFDEKIMLIFKRFMKRLLPVCIAFVCFSCSRPQEEKAVIRLSYTINFNYDAIDNKLEGLKWTLSYLGAALPDSSFEKHCRAEEYRKIFVRFDSLGFSPEAVKVLTQLCDSLKNTAEYKEKNSIDIGEFIALTIGTSRHYYAITGVSPTFNDFTKNYFSGGEQVFPVLSSAVSKHHRRLRLHMDTAALKTAFVAEEGSGDIDKNTFVAELFEVFDVMPNGQLRFAIYDKDGQLTDGSPSYYGDVGKPAKCLWCHEQYIQPLFKHTPDVNGYMTEDAFTELVRKQMEVIAAYRKTLNSSLDYERTMEHMQMELLYISYMEPSRQKLSEEWDMEEEELKTLLAALPVHEKTEFPFLGKLYDRVAVHSFAPYLQNPVPSSIRELGGKDPVYLVK
ncbi:MAG: hypothetical protein K0S33_345 [Bacteroidetes bacterium]|jgi:hypothetical protein|nr:hypothetical protein [Bacteroidota bacterium]